MIPGEGRVQWPRPVGPPLPALSSTSEPLGPMIRSAVLVLLTLVPLGTDESELLDRLTDALLRNPRPGPTFERWLESTYQLEDRETWLETLGERDHPYCSVILALLDRHEGRRSAARTRLDPVLTAEPAVTHLRVLAAQWALEDGDEASAMLHAREALDREATDTERESLEDVLAVAHLRLGERDEALALWDRAFSRNPDDLWRRESAIDRLIEEGADEAALQYLEELQRLVPTDNLLHVTTAFRRAELLAERGENDPALEILRVLRTGVAHDSWIAEEADLRSENIVRRTSGLNAWIERLVQRVRATPDDLRSRARLCALREESGDIAGALAEREALVALAPEDREQRRQWIELLDRSGRVLDARREATALLDHSPEDVEARALLSRTWCREPATAALAALGDLWDRAEPHAHTAQDWEDLARALEAGTGRSSLDSAIERFVAERSERWRRRALGLEPNAARVRALCEALTHLGNADAARQELLAWSRADSVTDRFAHAADIAAALGDRALERELLEQWMDQEPDALRARRRLAGVLEQEGDFASADECWRFVQTRTNEEHPLQDVLMRRVSLLRNPQAIEDALAVAVREAEQQPAVATHWHAALLAQALRRSDAAFAHVAAALAIEPEHGLLSLTLGEILAHRGEGAAARAQLDSVAERFPQLAPRALEQRALLELAADDLPAALATAEELLREPGTRTRSLALAAQILERGPQPERALHVLRRLTRERPHDIELRTELAEALERSGAHEEAAEQRWRAYVDCLDAEQRARSIEQMADRARRTGTEEALAARMRRHVGGSRSWALRLDQARLALALGDEAAARRALDAATRGSNRGDELLDEELLDAAIELARGLEDARSEARLLEQRLRRRSDPAQWERLARLQLALGEEDRSLQSIGRLLRTGHGSLLEECERHLRDDDDEFSVVVLQAAIRHAPDSYLLLHRLALTALRADRPLLARRALLRLLELAPVPTVVELEGPAKDGPAAEPRLFPQPMPFLTLDRVLALDLAPDEVLRFRTEGVEASYQRDRLQVSAAAGPPRFHSLVAAATDDAFAIGGAADHPYAWPPSRVVESLRAWRERGRRLERTVEGRGLHHSTWQDLDVTAACADALYLVLDRFPEWSPVADTAIGAGTPVPARHVVPLTQALLALGRDSAAFDLLPDVQAIGWWQGEAALRLAIADSASRGGRVLGGEEWDATTAVVEEWVRRAPGTDSALGMRTLAVWRWLESGSGCWRRWRNSDRAPRTCSHSCRWAPRSMRCRAHRSTRH